LAATAAPDDERKENRGTPAEQYRSLLKEFQNSANGYFKATTDDERRAITARVDEATSRMLDLAEKNPKEPMALEALVQVVTQEYWLNNYSSHPGWGKSSRQARAIALILRDHLESDTLGEACRRVAYGYRQECETFLRTVFERSPHRDVKGTACLRLAQFLVYRAERLDLLEDQPELARRYEELYGKGYMDALKQQDRAKVMKEAETLYEQASEKFGDVKLPYDVTVGEQAKADLFEVRQLAVGKEAPAFTGEDQDGTQFKLSDYRGKVVLVYFWSEY
jgi:hypothetical protein